MTWTCPVCKAVNDAGPNCRRCKADLSLLIALESTRAAHLTAARHALVENRYHEARTHLLRAEQLRPDTDIRQLLAVLEVLRGRWADAWQMYHRESISQSNALSLESP